MSTARGASGSVALKAQSEELRRLCRLATVAWIQRMGVLCGDLVC